MPHRNKIKAGGGRNHLSISHVCASRRRRRRGKAHLVKVCHYFDGRVVRGVGAGS